METTTHKTAKIIFSDILLKTVTIHKKCCKKLIAVHYVNLKEEFTKNALQNSRRHVKGNLLEGKAFQINVGIFP